MKSQPSKPQYDVFKYKGEPIRITLGTIVLVGLCSFLIIIATFTQLSFKHFIIPVDFMTYLSNGVTSSDINQHFVKYYRYIPQIPVIVFIAALMGKTFGIISVLIYICIGLFCYPVFALGGGPHYIFEYNFGYIIAYIPAVFFTGSILKSGFSFKNILQASIVAVLTVHIIGIIYTFFIGAITQTSDSLMYGWIVTQSGTKILYDIVFSMVAIVLANLTKKFLWITMC